MTFRTQVRYLLTLLAVTVACQAAAENVADGCGSLATTGGGPWDYRAGNAKIHTAEQYHFDAGVENLVRGMSTAYLAGDIDFVLRASPNHHRALMAMMKLGLKEKSEHLKGANYTVHCYMVRAERFQPDDAMVKVIFGLYYLNKNETREGIAKLEEARTLDSSNANVSYNLGLAYLRLKKYDKALEAAHAAYRRGFPLPGLRHQLEQAGRWKEP